MIKHDLTLQEQRDSLARFMGYTQKDLPDSDTWFERTELAYYVASEYKSWQPDRNWEQLMLIIEKIRSWNRHEGSAELNELLLDEMSIGNRILSIKLYKWTENGWEFPHIFHIHDPNNLDQSDCNSFQELLFKSAVDFAYINNS